MSWAAQRWDELRLAVMLLSRLPAGRIDRELQMSAAAWAFPLVGVPVGLVAGSVHWAALSLGAPFDVAAVLALIALVWLTGGLHHDGLADFADCLGGSTRERRLDIMRDSRIGSYGVLALILALALFGTSIASLGALASLPLFVFAAVVSRFAMLTVLLFVPPARNDGLGRGAFGSGARAIMPGLVFLVAVSWPLGSVALVSCGAVLVVGCAIGRLAYRALGGHTGDVLGAVQVSTECAIWLVLALILARN